MRREAEAVSNPENSSRSALILRSDRTGCTRYRSTSLFTRGRNVRAAYSSLPDALSTGTTTWVSTCQAAQGSRAASQRYQRVCVLRYPRSRTTHRASRARSRTRASGDCARTTKPIPRSASARAHSDPCHHRRCSCPCSRRPAHRYRGSTVSADADAILRAAWVRSARSCRFRSARHRGSDRASSPVHRLRR